MEVKGLCRDCLFVKQEKTVFEDKRTKQLKIEVDWACSICDIFKPLTGYCDMWEPQ
jgi:hypothetical protein